jgi:hypothetical protein
LQLFVPLVNRIVEVKICKVTRCKARVGCGQDTILQEFDGYQDGVQDGGHDSCRGAHIAGVILCRHLRYNGRASLERRSLGGGMASCRMK